MNNGIWVKTTLGDVAECRNGAGIQSRYFRPSGIPLARISDFVGDSIDLVNCTFVDEDHAQLWRDFVLNTGDVLVATVGSWPQNEASVVGRVVSVPKEAAGAIQNQNTACISPKSDLADRRFLYYLLRNRDFADYAAQSAHGSASQARLAVNNLKQFSFLLPPLPIQREIAHILGSLDDKIDLNRRMNATLESIAHALFKSWFVDFDPVRAKAQGRQPDGIDAATAALFPDSFQDSDLGPIPAGWRVSTVGDEFNLTMGQSPPGETYNEQGIGMPFYQGRRDFGSRYPTRRVYCSQPTRLANAGDTLISVRAPVGHVNMALEECAIGRGVASARHKSDSRSFTFYSMMSLEPIFENYNGEGTVFGSISGADFKRIQVIHPPHEVIHQFEQLTFSLDQSIENNVHQTNNLEQIRDALLPRLMSGEIEV